MAAGVADVAGRTCAADMRRWHASMPHSSEHTKLYINDTIAPQNGKHEDDHTESTVEAAKEQQTHHQNNNEHTQEKTHDTNNTA